jgi:CRP/FNR family cyclic AMP-dependent transcriptional regulator
MSLMVLRLFEDWDVMRSVAAGEFVFKTGDAGEYMYVLVSGQADIVVNGKVVEHAEPGAIIGEMALVDNEPRSASLVAKGDCKLAQIDRQHFESLVQHTPIFALEVMSILARRLRNMDRLLKG